MAPVVMGPPYDHGIITTLRQLAKSNHFVYPHSDHSGKIIEVGTNDSGTIIGPGDAFIIHPDSPIKTGFIRTCDCVPILLSLGRFSAGIHISNTTELGWRLSDENFEPISKKVLNRVVQLSGESLDQCKLHIGPCIAGVKPKNGDACSCYGYTETHNQPDGTDLIRLIQAHHPDVDLEYLFFRENDQDKIYFRWGEIMMRIFQSLGIKLENIHNQYNYCTRCNSGWWSNREFQNTTDPAQRELYQNSAPSNLAWITRV
ncbi:MAG: laccase domain-containing protein [Patescibacteria group bacterium]